MTIQELRKEKGLNQGQFAASIGVSRTTIVGYEKGKFAPSRAVVEKVLEVYGVNIGSSAAESAPRKRTRKKAASEAVSVPAAIKALRKQKGMSQTAFAQSIGVSTQSIGAYETGKFGPSKKVLARVKEAYGVDLTVPAAPIAKKPAKKEKKPTAIVIQSPAGAVVTPEEILAKVGQADTIYIRADENKAYWVKGEETGSVALWD